MWTILLALASINKFGRRCKTFESSEFVNILFHIYICIFINVLLLFSCEAGLYKLSINILVNKSSVDFLDINLDLNSGVYKPCMKENNSPMYVKQRNNLPSIVKNIRGVSKRRLSIFSEKRAGIQGEGNPLSRCP